jgi:hypothetical protein
LRRQSFEQFNCCIPEFEVVWLFFTVFTKWRLVSDFLASLVVALMILCGNRLRSSG